MLLFIIEGWHEARYQCQVVCLGLEFSKWLRLQWKPHRNIRNFERCSNLDKTLQKCELSCIHVKLVLGIFKMAAVTMETENKKKLKNVQDWLKLFRNVTFHSYFLSQCMGNLKWLPLPWKQAGLTLAISSFFPFFFHQILSIAVLWNHKS